MTDDMMSIFLEALGSGDASAAIENQEKRGQTTFAHNETMPIKGPWNELEAMGVVKGDPIDDLFLEASLPEGWEKRPCDHSMWSELFDDTGKKVASIFYKAAFYDRDAFFNVVKE